MPPPLAMCKLKVFVKQHKLGFGNPCTRDLYPVTRTCSPTRGCVQVYFPIDILMTK